MDWTKAKTILIVALIGTNIFLVFTFGFNDSVQKVSNTKEALLSVLSNNNITLTVDVPQKQVEMPVLYIEYKAFNQDKIKALIKEKKYGVAGENFSEDDLTKVSQRFLSDSGLLNENVVLNGVVKQGIGTVVQYRNEIKGVAIEESYIYCYFENGKLLSADSYWLEAVKLSNKKSKILSATEALIIFMNQVENKDEKIIINGIELVYWLDTSTFDGEELVTDTALPAWKVVYNGNQRKHIYAYEQ